MIGDTSSARKGSSFDHVTRLLTEADPAFPSRLTTGLSSGEGLMWTVRDPNGPDPGVADKRLLVARTRVRLRAESSPSREISTLSPTLRSAWDGRPLALLTRTAPARATSAHISIIGHITATELRRHTTTVEIANGFLNRFVLPVVRRMRLLPEGGDPDPLKDRAWSATSPPPSSTHKPPGSSSSTPPRASCGGTPTRSSPSPPTGSPAHLTARAEAHTIRLALLYALLDGQRRIQPQHLHAALALWDYAARSAAWALSHRRRPARRPDPRRADRAPRRADPHPAPRPLTATTPPNASTKHSPRSPHRQSNPHPLTTGRPAELWTATPAPAS